MDIFIQMYLCAVFQSFFLTHIASVIMPLVRIVSVVVSVSVTVPDGGIHSTVDFVFIFVSGICTYTLL